MGVVRWVAKRGVYILYTLKNSPTVLCLSLFCVFALFNPIAGKTGCPRGTQNCGLVPEEFTVIEGIIIYHPEYENYKIKMIIWDENLVSGIDIVLFSDEKIVLGDKIILKCKLKYTPDNYYKHLGVGFQASSCSKNIQVLHAGNTFQQAVSSARAFVIEKITNNFTASTSSLILGILIGETTGTPNFIKNDYRSAGILHIVAVSGFNMNIAASALTAIFRMTRIKVRLLLGIGGMFFYLAIVGFNNIPGLRAFLCMTIMAIAKFTGRKPNTTYITGLVALVLMLFMPGIQDSVSFQLSVLAGFAMSMPLKKLKVLIINFFLLPVIVFNFGSINLLGIISNIIILPFVTPLTYLAALYTLSPFSFTELLINPIDLIIRGIQGLAGFIGRYSFLNFSVESGNYWIVAVLVVLLIIFIIEVNYKKFH